ncbi:MAG: tRNA (adenosine(37)-N6)-threonylcarbamoyltransferase complex transferase subunit TsaD [Saprospiraceae bacterium]
MSHLILAIESSCDDSSMAILRDDQVLANLTFDQKIHQKYGGVVPEWASRQHFEAMLPLYQEVCQQAGIRAGELNAIAVTQGPGLMGSLVVGLGFAKGLCLGLGIPLLPVNHLEAHVMSLLIDEPRPAFPFLCLTVSGGHTMLVLVRGIGEMELLGTTIDDAAGEAFDKIGKMLGLTFPGGPEIDRLAAQGQAVFKFPVSKAGGHNFSFSGLKTSVLYFLKKMTAEDPDFIHKNLQNLCASAQATIIEMLTRSLMGLAKEMNISQIGIAGGVSANRGLRNRMAELSEKHGWQVYFPALQYCTDNAAMIGITAWHKFQGQVASGLDVSALARYPLPQAVRDKGSGA